MFSDGPSWKWASKWLKFFWKAYSIIIFILYFQPNDAIQMKESGCDIVSSAPRHACTESEFFLPLKRKGTLTLLSDWRRWALCDISCSLFISCPGGSISHDLLCLYHPPTFSPTNVPLVGGQYYFLLVTHCWCFCVHSGVQLPWWSTSPSRSLRQRWESYV